MGQSSANVVWFLSGLTTGAAIGLLLAPRSGAATRHMIGERAGDAGELIVSSGRGYYDRGRELYERGRHLAEEAAQLFDEGRRLMESADATGARA